MSDLISSIQDGDWREGRITGNPAEPGYVVERICPNVQAQSAPAIMVALTDVTSITSPVIDGQTLYGPLDEEDEPTDATFAVATHQTRGEDDRSITIIQRLTKTSTTAPDADALLSSHGYRTITASGAVATGLHSGTSIVREWRMLDTASVKTIVAAKRGESGYPNVTDPVIEGVTYKGTFARGEIVVERGDDNTATLREPLTKVTHIAPTADGATVSAAILALAPEVQEQKQRINSTSFSVWEADLSTLTLVFPWLSEGSKGACMETLTKALAETLLNTSAADVDEGAGKWIVGNATDFELADRQFVRDPETNVGTFRLIYSRPEMNAFGNDTAEFKNTAQSSSYGTDDDQEAVGTNSTKTIELRGLDIDDVETAVAFAYGDDTHVISSATAEGNGPEAAIRVVLRRQFTHEDDNGEEDNTVSGPRKSVITAALDQRTASATCTWTRVSASKKAAVVAAAQVVANYGAAPEEDEIDGVLYWAVLPDVTGYAFDNLVERDNGDKTYDIVAKITVPRVDYSTDAIDNSWTEIGYDFDTTTRRPTGGYDPAIYSDNAPFPAEAADGTFWRMIWHKTKVKLYRASADNQAKNWVTGEDALFGSKSFMQGGQIRAEKVVDRTVGYWQAGSLADAKDINVFEGEGLANTSRIPYIYEADEEEE